MARPKNPAGNLAAAPREQYDRLTRKHRDAVLCIDLYGTRQFMRFLLAASVVTCLVARGACSAEPAPKVDFNREIRPILSNVCFDCHGPDKKQRKAELRLDSKDDVYRDRGGFALVVPGKPAESELYSRLTDPDEKQRMPPQDALRKIDPSQIELIRRWIEQGAPWQGHWAYEKPIRPEAPEVSDPDRFVRNDIDRFILSALRAQGQNPSREADRATLLRRLSFDLIGLPPTPDEVTAFVNDPSPRAYEATVDRLLASPHFGERMAMFWLDLVRYADTNGYHGDNHEDRDLYRDWVIGAFNDNLPFDRFTVEQLAGDLLPKVTDNTRIASGYNRLLMTTREGGAQAREYMAKYAADRVRNFSAVWLAGTMGCCECHDHKYDPFTTRDFYSLASFFADIQEIPVGEQPGTKFPTEAQARQLAELDARTAEARKVLDTPTPELETAQVAWEEALRNRKVEWKTLAPVEMKSNGGATLKVSEDGAISATGDNPERDTYELGFRASLVGVTALRLEALPDPSLPAMGPGRADNGNFVLHDLKLLIDGKPLEWAHASATHSQGAYDVAGVIDGKPETGWAILDRAGRPTEAVFELKATPEGEGEATFSIVLTQNFGLRHTLGRFRFGVTQAQRPVRADGGDGLPAELSKVVATEPAQRSDADRQKLSAYYRTIAPALAPTRETLALLKKQHETLMASVRTTLVSTSGMPREMRVLARGNWLDDTGEVVQPAVPAFLGYSEGGAQGVRQTRHDLAQWVVDPRNPLTARVFVNRLWKIAFGQGLVRSVEDFGSQGTPPTHPELLDWLALEFASPSSAVAGGNAPWDVKRLLKLIVMSGAYRQSSLATPELRQRDPYNLWLARQARFRLDAEVVRDNALSVSGLIVHQLGGPSARPYQPAGYWSYLNFPVREWQADQGEGLYRRGLYTYWCRTFLHPSLKAFDAPTREECTADRPRSNTPLQALTLLNDATFVEAARAFAERIVREGGADATARVGFAFARALSRKPRGAEISLITDLYSRHLAQYRADAKAADELLRVGARPVPADLDAAELAAWTSVARVILNLHETMTRN
jgi:Protein of unknown function (DUF1553)/Protein of unknown function (DUF1549)/Planctomycete cytochrome C